MDMNIINSVQRPMPAAAKLGDVGRLYDLARNKSVEARDELTRSISIALEEKLSVRESELIADVLITLLKQAERDMRMALAEKLSFMDDVPLRLVLHLANDEIEVARPILKRSSVLGEFDLLYIIKSKTSEYWRAIATREALSEQVITVLADADDFETAVALAKNNHIKLSGYVLTALADLAQESEVLSVPLLRRDDVPAYIAAKLYAYVCDDIKRFIIDNYDVDIQLVERSIKATEKEFKDASEGEKDGYIPSEELIRAARTLKERGTLNVKVILATLRRGQMHSFVAQLSVFTSLPAVMVSQVLSQENGQGLAIVSKAYDISKQDFITMFMLTNKLWNCGRIVDGQDLKKAQSYYDKATKEIAIEILKSKSFH